MLTDCCPDSLTVLILTSFIVHVKGEGNNDLGLDAGLVVSWILILLLVVRVVVYFWKPAKRQQNQQQDEEMGNLNAARSSESSGFMNSFQHPNANNPLVVGKIVSPNEEETEETTLAQVEVASPLDGMDYVAHKVTPTDTFQGICLRYKITPTDLRRTNGLLSGSDLRWAPPTLWIPVYPHTAETVAGLPPPRPESNNEKIVRLRGSVPYLARTEARAYLELNDWNVASAIEEAREDLKYDSGRVQTSLLATVIKTMTTDDSS